MKETGFPTERADRRGLAPFPWLAGELRVPCVPLGGLRRRAPAPWSGERRHLPLELMPPKRPPHRSPDGKVFYDQKYRPK